MEMPVMRRPIRLLLPILLLAAAALACNRSRDDRQEPAPRADDSSEAPDEAADQVEALLDELEAENNQADSAEGVTVEPAQEAEPPPTDPAGTLSPESEDTLATLEALMGELDDLNTSADPLDDLP
jgi:outer membrane biosynthesis protein TonB